MLPSACCNRNQDLSDQNVSFHSSVTHICSLLPTLAWAPCSQLTVIEMCMVLGFCFLVISPRVVWVLPSASCIFAVWRSHECKKGRDTELTAVSQMLFSSDWVILPRVIKCAWTTSNPHVHIEASNHLWGKSGVTIHPLTTFYHVTHT